MTDKGARNPGRVAFAVESLRRFSPTRTARRIAEQFEVCADTAWRDIREARKLLAATAGEERPRIRAMETIRLERIAEACEDLAKHALQVGELAAAAAAYRAAIGASREIGRLNGAHVQGDQDGAARDISPELAMQLDAILTVLDEQGRAAFRIVQEQIERAKADGRFESPATQLDAIYAMLDEEDLADLARIEAKIAAARAAGRLSSSPRVATSDHAMDEPGN